MFSRKDRMKAIKLYIKNVKHSAKKIYELGYPSRNLLRIWYRKYLKELKTVVVWDSYKVKERYTSIWTVAYPSLTNFVSFIEGIHQTV